MTAARPTVSDACDGAANAAGAEDRTLVSEDVGCNNKGFQIRHLELQSRGDKVWKPFFADRGSLPTHATFTSSL